MSLKKTVSEIENKNKKKPIKKERRLFLPTSSTLQNLCCSDRINGGFLTGRMVNVIGDSSSGKTMFCLALFAEAAKKKEFDEYRFLYNDAECACEFNLEKLFGKKVKDRIEFVKPSETVQDWEYSVMDAFDKKKPFVYIIDSLDALVSEEDLARIEERRKAHKTGKKMSGSYELTKQKYLSGAISRLTKMIEKSKSILVIISQTRDKIGIGFDKKTRAGGRALKYYATHEIWFSIGRKIDEKIGAKNRVVGFNVISKTTKSKINGKVREAKFPIYYNYGIDDIQSCINFLVEEGEWKKGTKGVVGSLYDPMPMKTLIRKIESDGKEQELKMLVKEKWMEIEEKLNAGRKKRYE